MAGFQCDMSVPRRVATRGVAGWAARLVEGMARDAHVSICRSVRVFLSRLAYPIAPCHMKARGVRHRGHCQSDRGR